MCVCVFHTLCFLLKKNKKKVQVQCGLCLLFIRFVSFIVMMCTYFYLCNQITNSLTQSVCFSPNQANNTHNNCFHRCMFVVFFPFHSYNLLILNKQVLKFLKTRWRENKSTKQILLKFAFFVICFCFVCCSRGRAHASFTFWWNLNSKRHTVAEHVNGTWDGCRF